LGTDKTLLDHHGSEAFFPASKKKRIYPFSNAAVPDIIKKKAPLSVPAGAKGLPGDCFTND